MENRLYVHISLELKGNTSPPLFADKVTEALPSKETLAEWRASSIPAMLPITFRLPRQRPSDPQSYLQISNKAVPQDF